MTLLVRLAAMAVLFGCSLAARAQVQVPPAIVEISSDGRELEIKRSSDREAIRVPILARCGDPPTGPARIQDVQVTAEKVFARFAHCEATVALKTLAVACACD
jgi:hypothetical protein